MDHVKSIHNRQDLSIIRFHPNVLHTKLSEIQCIDLGKMRGELMLRGFDFTAPWLQYLRFIPLSKPAQWLDSRITGIFSELLSDKKGVGMQP